ncbi:hypothetical protein [Marinitoga lauensis]|uniref:hypothetical protein n=1 Tax=Marinitoga lauensis TaxID=2201189 RepID=UPI001013053C|nr:hypothetical protein [Marinitoga lauensis]
MIFPGDIIITRKDKIIITAKGKDALNNEIFKFKSIKIKDLLSLLLKEMGFNQYYLTDIPDKSISLDLKVFYPEDLFRIILDSTGIYYNYISTKDVYISKSPLYSIDYPIISSNDSTMNDDDEIYVSLQTNIPNFNNLLNLISLKFVKIKDSLYVIKGTKDKIELVKKIINTLPKQTEKQKKIIIKDSPEIIKNKIHKVFEYNLPQKDIIKVFNIEYSEITSNLILLTGFEEDISLFEEFYNKAYEIFQKSEANKKPDKPPIKISEEPTSVAIENDSTITIIDTDIPIENLTDTLDLTIKKVDDTIYIVKGKNVENLSNLISKIRQIKEMKINKNYNDKNLKNDEKIEIIHSNLDLLPFNKIFKDTIIQKIDKNYIIKGTEKAVNTIKDFNEKYDIKETKESSPVILPKKFYYFTVKNDEYKYFSIILKNLNIDHEIIYENNTGKVLKIQASESDYKNLKELLSLKII